MTRLNLLLLGVLVAGSVYLVHVTYQARRLFGELDRAQAESRRLDTEYGRLQAERQAQATPLRVEKTARDKLQMRSATPAIAHYVPYRASEPSPADATPSAGFADAPAAADPARPAVARGDRPERPHSRLASAGAAAAAPAALGATTR